MDPSTKIPGTSILLKHVLELLEHKHPYYRRMSNLGKSVTSFDSTNISTGFGHGSIVYKLNLHFTCHSGLPSETLTVALKVPGIEYYAKQRSIPSDVEASISSAIAKVHKYECHFYDDIAPHMNIKIPKVYATKEWDIGHSQGYILMDDMSEEGVVLSKYDSVSPGQIKAVVKEIAHFHAEYLKLSDKCKPKFKNHEIWSQMTDEFIKLVPAFIELVADREKVAKDLNKILDVAGNPDFHLFATRDSHQDIDLPTVLVHGDLWNSNVFFQRDINGEAGNDVLAFIDWQLMHEGSPAADITRYLVLDADGVVRRAIEPIIFDFYIQCLRSEIPSAVSFNETQLRQAYHRTFITQVCSLIVITVCNVQSLQKSIDDGEDIALNSAKKDKILLHAIHAIEDAAKFVHDEIAAVTERFRKPKT